MRALHSHLTLVSLLVGGCHYSPKTSIAVSWASGAGNRQLQSDEDRTKVDGVAPANGFFINKQNASSININGQCISNSTAVLISVSNPETSGTFPCDPATGKFSGSLDLSKHVDGTVEMKIEFLKSIVSKITVYQVVRALIKDTIEPNTILASPSLSSDSVKISIPTETDFAKAVVTFTDVSTGTVVGPLESSSGEFSRSYLEAGKTYTAEIIAVDVAGNRSVPATRTITVPFPTPPNPNGLTATTVSPTRIDLSLTSGGGSTGGFRIAFKEGVSAPADCHSAATGVTLISEQNISTTTQVVTGLSPATNYTFRLCVLSMDSVPVESLGITIAGTTSLTASAVARGQYIETTWAGGVPPYVASLYTNATCTSLIKSTGSTTDTQATFGGQTVPGTYYFKVSDSLPVITDCKAITMTAPGQETFLGWAITEINKLDIQDESGEDFNIWQFEWPDCSSGAGRNIWKYLARQSPLSIRADTNQGVGSHRSFLVSSTTTNLMSRCIQGSLVTSDLIDSAEIFDTSAFIKLTSAPAADGVVVSLNVSLHSGTDTSCSGAPLFTSNGRSLSDYVALSSSGSPLQKNSKYQVKVSRFEDSTLQFEQCDPIWTRPWVKTFSLTSANITATPSVDLTWTGAVGTSYTLLRFTGSCDGPASVIYSGSSAATLTD